MKLNTKQLKYLRKVAHDYSPLVTVADKGLSDSVIAAIDEVLGIHELVKIKVRHPKPQRAALCAEICNKTAATEVQKIGMILLIYRPSTPPKLPVPGLRRGA